MMIVKLQSDHARKLYKNSIYSLVLKISITLKFIGQKLVELLNHPRKHIGKITSINLSPPPSRKKYGTLSGKFPVKSPIKHLSKNHIKATSKKDIADLLAKTFSKNSSSTNHSKPFQNIKKNAEKSKLNFKSNNLEHYNQPLSLSLNWQTVLWNLIKQLSVQMRFMTNSWNNFHHVL